MSQVLKVAVPAIITSCMHFHHYKLAWKSKQKEKEKSWVENILLL